MKYFCNGKKGFCDHDNECQSTCEFFDGSGGYYAEVVTNADRIRAMSNEELAELLDKAAANCCIDHARDCRESCVDCIHDWLRQPVKDGDT